MREVDDGDGKVEAHRLSAVTIENQVHFRNVLQRPLQAFVCMHSTTFPCGFGEN